MQVKKQQLEVDMEQPVGSKLGEEYYIYIYIYIYMYVYVYYIYIYL